MNLTLLVTGHLRTWRGCLEQNLKTFSNMGVDLSVVVVTYTQQYGYHPVNCQRMNDFSDGIWKDGEYNDFCNTLKDNTSNWLLEVVENRFPAGGTVILPQLLTLKRALTTAETGGTEGIFVRIRPDCVYSKFSLDHNFDKGVLVDDGNVFPNDCFLATTHSNMVNICKDCMINHERVSHTHELLLNGFNNLGLEIYAEPIMEYVLRKNGKFKYLPGGVPLLID